MGRCSATILAAPGADWKPALPRVRTAPTFQ